MVSGKNWNGSRSLSRSRSWAKTNQGKEIRDDGTTGHYRLGAVETETRERCRYTRGPVSGDTAHDMPAHEVRAAVETCPRRFLFTTSHESGVSLPALTARRPHPDTALSPSSRPTQDKENVSSPMATLNASMGEVNRDYHRRVRPWPTATCHRPVDTTDALVFSGEPFTQRQQRRVLMSTPRPRGSREGPAPTTSGTTVLTLFPRIPTHPPPPPDSRRGGGVHGVGHIPTSRGHGCESGGVVCVG